MFPFHPFSFGSYFYCNSNIIERTDSKLKRMIDDWTMCCSYKIFDDNMLSTMVIT